MLRMRRETSHGTSVGQPDKGGRWALRRFLIRLPTARAVTTALAVTMALAATVGDAAVESTEGSPAATGTTATSPAATGTTTTSPAANGAPPDALSVVSLEDRILSSVVGIRAISSQSPGPRAPGDNRWHRPPLIGGTGSGIIVDTAGTVLTCAHVVGEAKVVRIILADDREFSGRVKVLDRASDLALISAPPSGFPPIDLTIPPSLAQGERVHLASRAGGVTSKFDAGQLAAAGTYHLGHSQLEFFRRFMGKIEPGDSGGALVDAEGRFIGLVSVGHPQGSLGYAIAREFVLVALARMGGNGPVVWPWLGIGVETPQDPPGILVWTVVPGSAADAAGVRVGDRIVALDDHPIEHFLPTMLAIVSRPVGTRFRLQVLRSHQGKVSSAAKDSAKDGAKESAKSMTLPCVSAPRPIDPVLPALDLFERLTGIQLEVDRVAGSTSDGLKVRGFSEESAREERPCSIGSRLVAIVPGAGLVHGLEEGRADQEMKIGSAEDLGTALRKSFDGPQVAAALVWSTRGELSTMLLSGEAKQYPLL